MPKMGRNTVYIEEPYLGTRMAYERSKNLLHRLWQHATNPFITAWQLHSNTLATPPASWWCVLPWESEHHFFFNLSVKSFVHFLVAVLHQHTGLVYPWPVPVCDGEALGTVHGQRFVPGCVCEGKLPFWMPGLSVWVKKWQHRFAWFQVG